ncbi:RIP-like protein [Ceratitis capitata]|uniref:RIP-like protein n=2 Tax=Ceratitis capitata TaxID=7213 RepID=W8BVN5_CERCA|nr:RIP-like protein [Ceratitis capitata]
MSLECPKDPEYHTSVQQKLHSKNAAKVYRYGSPKIRDQLRDKCRMRVREARQASFNKRRLNSIAENLDIDKLLREELANLEDDLVLQEEIFKELRDEMNEWFIQELEAEETFLIDAADDDNNDKTVICPICQQKNLNSIAPEDNKQANYLFKCTCGVSFISSFAPQNLRKFLHTQVDAHEKNCIMNLTFYLEPRTADAGSNNLCAICDKCDYFYSF